MFLIININYYVRMLIFFILFVFFHKFGSINFKISKATIRSW